jgi:DNA-binding transcriptional MocR family regulator
LRDKVVDDFGVSRNPVREAIRVLEAEGFLHAQPRRGAVVASMSVRDVEDLFDVRLSLETLAAERAGAAGAAGGPSTGNWPPRSWPATSRRPGGPPVPTCWPARASALARAPLPA